MRQRLLSSLLLIPLIAILWFGGSWIFALLVGFVALLGIKEFLSLISLPGKQFLFLGFLFTSLFIANAYFDYSYTAPLFIAVLVLPLVWLLFRFPRREALTHWKWMLAGIVYLGLTTGSYVALRNLDQGREWVFLVLFSVFACDTSAFFIGRSFGRHPLAPAISPKKTWEGAIGGFFAAPAAALILYIILDITTLNYFHVVLIGLLIGVFAQLGDLLESWFKRRVGVKDSGNLIPGHGGILDRIDSLILAGIIIYYYALFLNKGWI